MSIITAVRDALIGPPLSLPATNSLDLPSHERGSPLAYADGITFYDINDPVIAQFLRTGTQSSAGVTVNESKSLRNAAVYRATAIISACLGMLPLNLWEKVTNTREVELPDGTKETRTTDAAQKATDHPLYNVLYRRPNAYMTPFDFKTFMVTKALLYGTAYAYIQRRVSAIHRGGFRIEMHPLDPSRVKMVRRPDWSVFFTYNDPQYGNRNIDAADMFWFRSPISVDGLHGSGLLQYAIDTIGLAAASEMASARVLKNGAIVGGVLEHPKKLSPEGIQRLREQFEARQSTPENAGRWVVAEDGLKAVPFGTTLKDAQNLEQRKHQVEEVARFTAVPRPLLMMDETSWGTGIEQLGLFFITYCLMPWFVAIEQAISRSLLSEAEQDKYYAKFNEAALLRGSMENQANFFSKALGSGGGQGWMSGNEVREKFEMAPEAGADSIPKPAAKGSPSGGDGNGQGNEGASPGQG